MSMSRIHVPATPISGTTAYSHGRSYSHKPLNSSPLAGPSSSPASSPIAAVQARRRSQYKAPRASLPLGSSSRSSTAVSRVDPMDFFASPDEGDDAQKAFLRTRLKLRCIERANKAREHAVQKKRYMSSSDVGSDDMDMEMDGTGDDDGFDELFTRVMQNTTRKLHHAYLYSYDREVGSDPISEDAWEAELSLQPAAAAAAAAEELEEDAILQAYLEEQVALAEEEAAAAFADFADIPADELFGSLSDLEGEDDLSATSRPNQQDTENRMDMS